MCVCVIVCLCVCVCDDDGYDKKHLDSAYLRHGNWVADAIKNIHTWKNYKKNSLLLHPAGDARVCRPRDASESF